MNITKQFITPEIAKGYLSLNSKNRRVKDPVVIRYSNDMKAGRWKEDTAELIKIFENGEIADGQHRLHAVVKSNIPSWFHVALNVKDDVMSVLDTGSLRSASDVFKISDIKYENVTPAIITLFHLLKNRIRVGAQKFSKLTNSSLLEEYYKRSEYWQITSKTSLRLYKSFTRILAPATIGGFVAFFESIDKNDAQKFMDQLCTGSNIEHTTILLLRNKLIADKISLKKLPTDIKYAFIIKSWNSFRCPAKPPLKVLKFDSDKEYYPIAI